MNRMPLAVGAVGLLALGSASTYLVMKRSTSKPTSAPIVSTAAQPPAQSSAPTPDVALTLSADAVKRAGIVVGRASAGTARGELRIPAVVEPNAYRAVVVTPIAAGRVTSVSAQLGQEVRRGQALAQIYSPELAEAQSRYLAARAEADAHERELRRTEKLAEIGSASRQELERIHAEHTAATTMVQTLRARLTLLGMTDGQLDKLSAPAGVTTAIAIPAPIDGVVTARTANVGLNVDPSTQLFTVVDLSTVWLVGDLYERDFSDVHPGSIAMVTTSAFPDRTLEGKVSYIDPAINPQTRTARVRVEVPNPGRQLRIGMYAEMRISQSQGASLQPKGGSRVVVPRAAVQIVGNLSVVYLADAKQPGRFVERQVQLGAANGENIEVTSGLQPGDPVVISGSFSLRAERERLGLGAMTSAPSSPPTPVQSTRITVSEKGFEPSRVPGRAGMPVRLTFMRTTDATCATKVTIPALKITRDLPLNQLVDIDLTPQHTGEIEFACGMDMLKGTLVVQ
jgi:membrane fusion protein, heavy metal efflux system